MKFNIIVPYRPLSKGFMQPVNKETNQLPDGKWLDEDGIYKYGGHHRWGGDDELIRAIEFLNKNSVEKHNIIVAIDNDVHQNDAFLKQYDNVMVVKSDYICKEKVREAFFRINAAIIAGLNIVPDDEWACCFYVADTICGKMWDKPIIDSINRYGDNYVHAPMFVEIRSGYGSHDLKGIKVTPELIWKKWHDEISWNALMMPEPDKGYCTEEDLDDYIKVATSIEPDYPQEPCGARVYGTYLNLVVKAKYAKSAAVMVGPGYDLQFDDRLWTVFKLMKIPVTKSFLFHPYQPFIWKGYKDATKL